jgi:xanthine dehydrogenase accessory factor
MNEYDQIPETALNWKRAGKSVALATVVETWGSAPRQVGSQLAISGDMEMAGSVSGGCVEGAVVAEALEILQSGLPRVLQYGISDADAFSVGLACGGTIRILVEPIGVGQGPSLDLLEKLVAHRAAREPVIYEVDLRDWSRRLVLAGEAADARFHSDKSGFDGDVFRGVHNPPLRMAVIGAVHVAQALLPMAKLAGFDVVLIDPRDAFAADARFPGQVILRERPDEGLRTFGLDARTAVVTLTHDPKLDDPAIVAALGAPVFYLGSLGSKKTHAKRLERLSVLGFSSDDLARIHAPVGADIGAKSPAEIAVSILAQVIERLRRPETRP